ncbi:hypothetical protein DTW90_36160 [Neorhizobium sp. P12A]|nr:hypothetical protein DTW90_36160 [Neorhizobium sp. P12A]
MEAAISAYLKEMGNEAVAWRWKSELFDWNLTELPPVDQHTMEAQTGVNMRGLVFEPLFLAPSEDIEKLKAERDNWIESARQFNRDADFYRGIVCRIGDLFGDAAKTSDDGSLQDSVLALKVPELVRYLKQDHYADIQKANVDLFCRLKSAEAERDAKAALLEEARRVLEPFSRIADNLGIQTQRLFLQLLICPEGDEHPENYGPQLSAAKSFLARLEQTDAAK